MENRIKNKSDITYKSELIPHHFSIQVFTKKVELIKGAGSIRTHNLHSLSFRKLCVH